MAKTASSRTTLSLEPRAFRIARQRAEARSISLGKAVSELIEEADRLSPKTRLEYRENGMPVLVPPPGTPKLTSEMVKQILEDEW